MSTVPTVPSLEPRFIPHDTIPAFNLYEDASGVRRFGNTNLQRYIEEAIKRRDPKKDVIAVAHVESSATEGTVAWLSAAVKLGSDWSIMAAGYKRFTGPTGPDWGVGAEVVWEP